MSSFSFTQRERAEAMIASFISESGILAETSAVILTSTRPPLADYSLKLCRL